jgi:sugar phosphate isomerase/epimerase
LRAATNAIAVEAAAVVGQPVEQSLDHVRMTRLREAGVQAIHVRVDEGPNTFEHLARLLGASLAPGGLSLSGVDVGTLEQENPASQSADTRGRALRAIRSACRFAAEYGADTVVISPGQPEQGVSYQATLDAARQTLSQAARYGSEAGVRVALATPAPGFLRSPIELRQLIEQIQSDAVGIALDLGGLVAAGEPFPANWIGEAGHAIALVRATDYSHGEAPGACVCGRGDVPWDECLRALEEAGYRGAFVVGGSGSEHGEHEATLEAAEASVRFLKQQLERPALEEVNR